MLSSLLGDPLGSRAPLADSSVSWHLMKTKNGRGPVSFGEVCLIEGFSGQQIDDFFVLIHKHFSRAGTFSADL